MPRFYFHLNDGSPLNGDGVELESVSVAQCEAVKLAGSVICESGREFWENREFNMTVSDTEGLTLFSLLFIGTEAAAIGLSGARPSL